MSGKTFIVVVGVLCLCSAAEIEVVAGFYLERSIAHDHASTQQVKNIIGGVPAKRNEFPFVASIHYPEGTYTGRKDLSGRHFCGGSLIARNVVLTAGHCVDDFWLNRFKAKPVVHLGRLAREGGDEGRFEIFKTRETRIHPEYNKRKRLDYDIALIVLDRDSVQELIGYHTDERCFNPQSGCDRGTVVGWGLTDFFDRRAFAERLLKVEVPLVPRDQCRKVFGFLTESMLCAGGPGKDSCKYDSGGPLLIEQKVAGVVSFGMGCGTGLPAVYGNVVEVKDWIQRQLEEINLQIPSALSLMDSRPNHIDFHFRSPRKLLPLSRRHKEQ